MSKIVNACTLKDPMGEVSNTRSESRSDIVCLEGNGYRPSHHGDGYRVGGAMYTLNSTEVHAVAYIYDARGNGDGKTCCSIVGGHQSSISDYTAIVLEIHEDDNTDREEIL